VPEDDAELEDEEAEKLQEMMEADYDTGSVLKEKIVPRAVAWFTGEAIEMDESDEEDDDEEGCVTCVPCTSFSRCLRVHHARGSLFPVVCENSSTGRKSYSSRQGPKVATIPLPCR